MGVGEAGLRVEVLVGDFLAGDLSGLDVESMSLRRWNALR